MLHMKPERGSLSCLEALNRFEARKPSAVQGPALIFPLGRDPLF